VITISSAALAALVGGVSVLSVLMALAVAWGVMRTTVVQLTAQVAKLTEQNARLADEVSQLGRTVAVLKDRDERSRSL
jgi:cell division protein FtsB